MPTYRYRCGSCDKEFDVWQSINDNNLTEHDACGGDLKKVMSPAGIVLKGSGFYRNDSRKGSGNGKAGSTDGSSSDGAKKESPSTTSDSGAGSGSSSGSNAKESSGSGTKESSGSAKKDSSGGSSKSSGSS